MLIAGSVNKHCARVARKIGDEEKPKRVVIQSYVRSSLYTLLLRSSVSLFGSDPGLPSHLQALY